MPPTETTETLLKDLKDAQTAKFAEFDKKFAGVVTSEALKEMREDIKKEVRQLIPADLLANIHREAKPELEKRAKMSDTWELILGRGKGKIADGTEAKEARMKALDVTVGANGGYLVGEEMFNEIVILARNWNFMEPLMRVIPTSPLKFDLPKENAGFTFQRGQVGQTPTISANTFNQINFSLSSLTGVTQISNVLVRYSKFDVAAYLNDQAARDMSDQHLKDWLTGSGSMEPLGIRNSGGIQTLTQAGSHLNEDDVRAVLNTHPTKYMRGNAVVWMMSKKVIGWVSELKSATGEFLFFNSREGRGKGLVQAGAPEQNMAGYLMGFPVYEHPNMPDTAFGFCDLSRYWAAYGDQMEVASSDQSQFSKNITEIRIFLMDDARLMIGNAYTEISGVVQ